MFTIMRLAPKRSRRADVSSFVLLGVLLVFLGSAGVARAELPRVQGQLVLEHPFIGELSAEPSELLAQRAIEEAGTPEERPEEEEQFKSPARAFIFSALVPGAGELYVGAKRGYIFLGVEAVAWTSSYFFHKSGKQKKDEYEEFADEHWDFPALGQVCDGSTYDAERDSIIRYFHAHDKEHFYEDIGKYPYYLCGWDDVENIDEYLDMRDNSNALLRNSDYAMMAALINHVVSAVDALRLARNYNMKLGYGIDVDLRFKGNLHSTGVMVVAKKEF